MMIIMNRKIVLVLLVISFLALRPFCDGAESQCSEELSSCDALASYYAWNGSNLSVISRVLSTNISSILSYNPQITNPNLIQFGSRVNVPFSCSCLKDKGFMGHQFTYQARNGTSYQRIAQLIYSNLTTVEMLRRFNSFTSGNIPVSAQVNVVVNCSCGDSKVSKDYGLFVTYPLRSGEDVTSLASKFGLPERLLEDYNPRVNFSSGSDLVFVPGKDQNGTFPKLKSSSSGISAGAIAGVSVAAVLGVVFVASCFYFFFYRDNTSTEESHTKGEPYEFKDSGTLEKESESGRLVGTANARLTGITVDKSVEFSYEELAQATHNFSLANKIGQGGFGSVFYGELRGEKAAIKQMDMQASKEFLAELKVLTHVHHLNLVRLIGYCIEGSLFLVYEYIENGNLNQHLRNSAGREPLPWSTRVQIALDSARGLEYIHEHTVPVYIHRDIKSANILIDKNYRAKVADFGLTKLTEVGSASLHTRLVGTFGYMPPEYAQYGDVSPKIDVYAFGVVLYELISAKEAIVKTNEMVSESKGLVALFEDAYKKPDPQEALTKLIDPRLGDDYPIDSVRKMAQLARVCAHENPQLRPTMRSIVVALMTLSSTSEDWDIGSFYENQGLGHLISGR
ncbi:OLC1v1020749C1 [Oldenlandia corymbosa var. corymbosa]|uniref:non-specific serine/threonine protein kinase n=1 Tax=Oldenlandia corymbosa var. corymbosa TaxID=529605 RepID=A0AAV1BWJ0_OLDCO|nr:OLC1v1020749C1 [Oldenlandia corymbosa var. corymbosa]